jgi:hypothetical protein
MPPDESLLPAKAEDIADALAFALRYSGRKRVHDSAEIMASIVAKRLVAHLERCGFVVMRKPPIPGSAAPQRIPSPLVGEG